MQQRIAQLNVNPQIVWRTLGPNQYSERPLIAITIRELLQNADDAIFASRRKDGKIIFDYEEKDGWGSLICIDNGVGMNEDTILDKFLCLGESEKADGSTGGFGIAKAAIIGACDRWSIKTQDNFLDSDMIGNSPISKMAYTECTKITLEWDLNSGNDALKPTMRGILKGYEFCHFSKLKSNAEISFRIKGIDQKETNKFNTIDSKQIDNNNNFTLTMHKFSEQHDDCKIYYRLNGLVQFMKDFTNYSDVYFIVDIKTDKTPQHADYPLGPSRETLKYAIESKIKFFTEKYRINNVSGKRAFVEKENEVKLYEGIRIGTGENKNNSGYYYSSIPSKFSTENLVIGDGNPIDYEFIVRRVNSSTRIDIYADNNRKLLYVWAKLLELGAEVTGIDKRETFGIGYILDDNTKAERYSYNNRIFYLINPRCIPLSKPQEAIPKLIFLVAHELAHSYHRDHNEDFTVTESDIYFKIYEKFAEVKWVRKFMREGIY